MIRRLLPSRKPAIAAALVAALSLIAALAYAADPFVIEKDAVTVGTNLDVDGGIKAKSITADSVKVDNQDLMALVTQLRKEIEALRSSVGQRISSTDGETLRVVRGTIKDNTVVAGTGFTLRRLEGGDGIYDIHFSTPFKGTPSASVTPLLYDIEGKADARIVAITGAKMLIVPARVDRSFSFIVIGPQ